jgi:hypothetical protein
VCFLSRPWRAASFPALFCFYQHWQPEAECFFWRFWRWLNSELKQVTFLTTRTAWVTSKDWVKGCDWWKLLTNFAKKTSTRKHQKENTLRLSIFHEYLDWTHERREIHIRRRIILESLKLAKLLIEARLQASNISDQCKQLAISQSPGNSRAKYGSTHLN